MHKFDMVVSTTTIIIHTVFAFHMHQVEICDKRRTVQTLGESAHRMRIKNFFTFARS